MPEDSVMTAPDTGATEEASIETNLSTTDTGADTSEAEAEQTDSSTLSDGGRDATYQSLKQSYREQKPLTAEQWKLVRSSIAIADRANQAVGGDLQRFQSEREAYQSLRGEGEESFTPEQVVEQVKAERQQLQQIFTDLQAGGTALIEELATDYPDSFPTMTVQAMDKLAATNNEAFSAYVAKSAFSYLASKQVPQQFTLLQRFLPESSNDPGTQIVIDAFNVIKEALTGLGSMASKEITLKKATPATNGTQGDPKEQDIATREANIRRYEWNTEAATPNQKLRDDEIGKVASARKMQLTEAEKSEVKAAIKEEFDTRLQGNFAYGNAMKGYLEANNKRAYIDRVSSEGKKLLPSIVSRHVNSVLDKRATAKAQPQNGKQPTNGTQPPVERKDATGVTWINASPASLGLQVDYMRTSNAMMSRNEAYIRGRQGLHKWKPKTA